MARKVRIQFAGAVYHVLNRGNYRGWIFKSEGARTSFLKCFVECAQAQGWRVHAWCLMVNHYHLIIETPEPNLVEGMKWLQSTFANRFNRFRGVNGHVFQGRYKAILLDGDAIGPVCHYIHLNPARAGLVEAEKLEEYEQSSFHQLWHPQKRWAFGCYETCLDAAGGLADRPGGRRLYRDYLAWLSAAVDEQKRLGFETMCRGWAKGADQFKKEVLAGMADERLKGIVEAEAGEMREACWERAVLRGLACLGKVGSDLRDARKGEEWKVALARYLRENHLTPHAWLGKRLHMGTPNALSSLVSRHRNSKGESDDSWKKLQNQVYVD